MTASLAEGHGTGLVAVVTGASAGIGLATARAFARRSTRLALVCRDAERGRRALEEIRRTSPSRTAVDLYVADLASFESVRRAARSLRAAYDRIDLLVNNGGAIFSRRSVSSEGLEMHLATNYAGHFLLTALLADRLARSERPQVLTLGSALARIAPLRLDDLAFERPYHLVLGYAQSKRAVALFTHALARRGSRMPLLANCVDPGFVRSEIHRGATGHQRWLARRCERFGRDPDETGSWIAGLTERIRTESITDRLITPAAMGPILNRRKDEELSRALWVRSARWLAEDERNRMPSMLAS